MRVQKFIKSIGNLVWVNLICEHCKNTRNNVCGYNEEDFVENIIPNMICSKCKKKSEKYIPLSIGERMCSK